MSDLINRAAIFSFIAVKEQYEELPYNAQKHLLAKGFQNNKIFENGELLDTLEKRALYPMVHCSTKPMSEINDLVLLRSNDIGEEFVLKQGNFFSMLYNH
ncbi:uncharacterized protein TNCT_701081 [Trichonephila clavata]|uniref:Uncharacterized protein n=1 Tax=Trichonephila clavata TaxID=2740835 RepID=A0A8X6HIU5_TRICU|nr:uncharacterized protein TNCT_701081 [Trichonephila clavata]